MSARRRHVRLALLLTGIAAAGYLALLFDRFPRLVAWENGNSDIASAYVLADAVSQGHTGAVLTSAQGGWLPLGYGLLTHPLGFHRALWEVSPALLLLASASLIGWCVARVRSTIAGLLTAALIICAAPTTLVDFTAPAYHNLTIPGTALLGAYLIWLTAPTRPLRNLWTVGTLLSVVLGAFLASDELLAVTGLLPFVLAAVVTGVGRRERRVPAAAAMVCAGTVAAALTATALMHALHFSANSPPPLLTRRLIPEHVRWLVQGLLRLGGGLGVSSHSAPRTVLIVATAAVLGAGLCATLWLAMRALRRLLHRPAAARAQRGSMPTGASLPLDAHLLFWALSLLCACSAYVVTTMASYPQTERYFAVAVPAVAATAPLLAGRPAGILATSAASLVFITAAIVALADGDAQAVVYQGADTGEVGAIEAAVRAQRLSVGYAGYWDAASVDWISHERLKVYPVTDRFGGIEPMYENRLASWYVPRPHTRTFLLLAPDDNGLAQALPAPLRTPQLVMRIGPVTLATYPFDAAAYFRAPTPYRFASAPATGGPTNARRRQYRPPRGGHAIPG